jgi:hypothetical protein
LKTGGSCNSAVSGPEIHTVRKINQGALRSVVESLRAKIAQQVNIIGKYKLLVNSQYLNWNNKTGFRKELPLGNLGSKKLATPESLIAKLIVFQILNFTDP